MKPKYLISFFFFFFSILCLGVEKSLELWKAEWTKHEELESQVQEERRKYAVAHRLSAPRSLSWGCRTALHSHRDKALGSPTAGPRSTLGLRSRWLL